ncbi:MAG: RNA 2'-phosphotransferase [Pseudomonadota bacterium]
MSELLKKRSKSLSYWLRHAPQKAGLELDGSGWAKTEDILRALKQRGLETDLSLLKRVVAENDKKRFEFSEDGTKIRARQGHSLKVEGSWTKADPPVKLYHGTVLKFLTPILREGLTKQKRHHVHLSKDIETAQIVGSRRGTAIILEIDAKQMAMDGCEFFLSANGVWLVDEVAPHYLTQLSSS